MRSERYIRIDNSIYVSIGITFCRNIHELVFEVVPLDVYLKYKDNVVKMIGLYSIRVPVEDVEEIVGAELELLKALYDEIV